MATVQAAGAVVWRRVGDVVEVLVVHRPRYDDWSLPKGKLDPGESWADGARREVAEETGCTGPLGPEVARVRYRDQKGRDKEVRYFSLGDPSGEFTPNDEVDRVDWLTAGDAKDRVTRAADADVIDELCRLLEELPRP